MSLSSLGPGASAKNICRPAIASLGSTAITSAITPIPPSHWVKARHRKSPSEWAEKSRKIVAPVVVNPDMDSKSPSMTETPLHR